MTRSRPNIVITGTPGTGKSSHSELLASNTGLNHLCINEVVKKNGCHEGWDEELKSYIVNDDKLLDHLEDQEVHTHGGYILDWHACDLFPESWIDLVVVLRADSSLIYDRLHTRGYGERKLQENLDSEIWGVLLEEAKEAFAEDIVVELKSEEADDVEANVERIEGWIGKWEKDREGQETGTKDIAAMAQE